MLPGRARGLPGSAACAPEFEVFWLRRANTTPDRFDKSAYSSPRNQLQRAALQEEESRYAERRPVELRMAKRSGQMAQSHPSRKTVGWSTVGARQAAFFSREGRARPM